MGMVHRMFGIASALVVVLVNSIAVTYFVGTSRWCREVVETYHLDAELVRRSAVLKRRAFPWAVAAMLVIVGVSALGAAADPATRHPWTANWVYPHLVGRIRWPGIHRLGLLARMAADLRAPRGDHRHPRRSQTDPPGTRLGSVDEESFLMRACIQRVSEARVSVDGAIVGEIGRGLVVLLGVARRRHGRRRSTAGRQDRRAANLRRRRRQDESFAGRRGGRDAGRQPVHAARRLPQRPAAEFYRSGAAGTGRSAVS